jgi:hypothetical protein
MCPVCVDFLVPPPLDPYCDPHNAATGEIIMTRTYIRRSSLIAASATLALAGTMVIAAPAQAANDKAACLAANVDVENVSCFETKKLAGTPTKGQVEVSWGTTARTDWSSMTGGIWMVRTPIAGEKSGMKSDYPNANSLTNCSSGNPAGFQDCFITFSGTRGSITLDFPVSMAGYQYILIESEVGVSPEGDTAAGTGAGWTDNDVVWVHKAYKYKVNGKPVVTRKCPAKYAKKCVAIVNLELNSDQGTGVPVSPTS